MSESFATLVRSYLDEPLRLDASDARAELDTNTVCFGVPSEPVDPGVVAAAPAAVVRQLRARFGAARAPVTFYAWYDEQAGRLRCALGSVAPDALPFGGPHRVVEQPHPVLARMGADEHPGFVPWTDLSEDADGEESEPAPLLVYAVSVTRQVVASPEGSAAVVEQGPVGR